MENVIRETVTNQKTRLKGLNATSQKYYAM